MSIQPGNQADHEAAIRTARALEIPLSIENLERRVTRIEEALKALVGHLKG